MFKKVSLFFLIAETPVHAGSGSELGLVDLPIQRERHTDYPKIEGSGLKGCIREAFENSNAEIKLKDATSIRPKDKIKYKEGETEKETDYISLVFGPEEGEEYSSAVSFTDARILLFPVKSLKGTFGWITCPHVLERFKEDLRLAGLANNLPLKDFTGLANTVPEDPNLIISDSNVVFEEYTFKVNPKQETKVLSEWLADKVFPADGNNDPYKYWRDKLKKDLVILSDDDFRDFVKFSTEVITRTRIDETKGTVQAGALWTEEYLPTDTILYSLTMTSPLRVDDDNKKGVLKGNTPDEEAENVMKYLKNGCPEIIQIGGNQTIGKGLMRIRFFKEVKNEQSK